MTRIKICGITNLEDALAAADAGADALGFVFAASPRQIAPPAAAEIVAALPPLVNAVGVFADADAEVVVSIAQHVQLDAVQLHGQESPRYCRCLSGKVIKRFRVFDGDSAERVAQRMAEYDVAAYLLDPGAGSGKTFDWRLAQAISRRLIVSGGLTPQNVGDAIRVARPFAVDVSSGVESRPGHKDHAKLREFVAAVRAANAG